MQIGLTMGICRTASLQFSLNTQTIQDGILRFRMHTGMYPNCSN